MGNYGKKLEKQVYTSGLSKEGYCLICGQHGKLTKDHVPPKGCNNKATMWLQFMTENVKNPCQGGTGFNTLCEKCNSGLLGLKYDPELINLVNTIDNFANSVITKKLILPTDQLVIIKPQRIAKSIVGHILAASSARGKNSPLDELKNGLHSYPFCDALRHYVLNEDAPLPDNIDIYFWVYPYKQQVMIKNITIAKGMLAGNMRDYFGHILKFQPLAFWILHDNPYPINLPRLVSNKAMAIDEKYQMPISLTNLPHLRFPEYDDNDHMALLAGKSAIIGTQK